MQRRSHQLFGRGLRMKGIINRTAINPITEPGFKPWIPILVIMLIVVIAAAVCMNVAHYQNAKKVQNRGDTIALVIAVAAAMIVSGPLLCMTGQGRPSPSGSPMMEGEQYIITESGSVNRGFSYITTGQVMDATGVPIHIKDDGRDDDGTVNAIDWLDEDGIPHEDGSIIYRGNGTISMYDSKGKPIRRQDPSKLKRMSIEPGSWSGYDWMGHGLKDDWATKHGIVNTSTDMGAYKHSPIPSATVDKGTLEFGDTLKNAWIMEFGGRFYALPVNAKTGIPANLFEGA